MNIYNKHI